VNLAIAEFGGLLDELLDVGVVHNVAGNGDSAAAKVFDLVGYGFSFLYWSWSVTYKYPI
jgi:hypothetical protein